MNVSIVTVNYKTVDYIEQMLTSLYAHVNLSQIEVFVVENGSGDDLSKLEKQFPDVHFLYSQKNLGFAGGCNLAIKQATGRYVVLVNPDIVFESDVFVDLTKHMDKDPSVGIGGVSLKNLDGTQQRCVARFPSPTDQLCLLLKIPHFIRNASPIKRWLFHDFDYTTTQNVEQVMGALFCIRRGLIDHIGLLDEGFFIWYEEVDYCRRAITAGWQVRYYADISAKHKGGSSFDRVGTATKQRVIRNSIRRYIKKHFGFGWWLVFVLGEPAFRICSRLAAWIKPT